MTIEQAIAEVTAHARMLASRGQYACEARKELRRRFPRFTSAVITAAIKAVQAECDFPTKRQMGH